MTKHYATQIPGSASFERPAWDKAGALRSHPQDAPEQCFDVEQHGSPYFVLTVRADVGDGRGREVAIIQGIDTGIKVHRPMTPHRTTWAQAMDGASGLAALLRSFEYLIATFEARLRSQGT